METYAAAVTEILRSCKTTQRLRVLLEIETDIQLPLQLSGGQYVVIVAGSRFPILYRLHKQIGKQHRFVTIVESHPRQLPVAPQSVDLLVMGLERPVMDVARLLNQSKEYIRTDGTLVFSWPLFVGTRGWLKRLFKKKRYFQAPHHLCQAMMAAGFRQVGQKNVRFKGKRPYVITMGTVSRKGENIV